MSRGEDSGKLSDEAIAAYAAHLLDLEDAVDAAQGDKKEFFEGARDAHGKSFVKSLKLAVKTANMDADKRMEAEEVDAGAERILEIMRKGLHVARGARAREIIEQFDAETGEIIEPASTTHTNPADLDPQFPGGPADGAEPDLAPVSSAIQSTAALMEVPTTAQFPVVQGHPPEEASNKAGELQTAGTQAPPVDTQQQAVPSNVTPLRKQWTFADKPHADCLNPTTCGGFSNLALCESCKAVAKMGQVA